MTNPIPPLAPPELPPTFRARQPGLDDVPAVQALVLAQRRRVRGDDAGIDPRAIESQVAGPASWTRRQVIVTRDGELVAWAYAHDRAAGRTNVDVFVSPDLHDADAVALPLLEWVRAAARRLARVRGLDGTTLDFVTYADDTRMRSWLERAGFTRARTWLELTRPVSPEEATSLPGSRPGVRIRPVRTHADGTPLATDLQTVHIMLEESFADHFNSYRESFPEFLVRMLESGGHRWDHWWLAEFELDGQWFPGGAVVSSVLPPDAQGVAGSYVDYIGVHRSARGRGIAKALLHTVIADAAERGRDRVDLEVDAESPTGADGIYRSMCWVEDHRTESWHATLGEPVVEPKEDFTTG